MLLDWFSRKHIDEFADSIVAELLRRFPQSGADLSTEKSAEKAMKTLDRIFSRISAFAAEHRPNLRSEEHTSELQSPCNLVCRLLLEKKKKSTRHGDGNM